MTRYRHAIDNVQSHVRSLWVVIGMLLGVIAALWLALMRIPADLTVHVPPDLRQGASQHIRHVPAENIYTFAYYILQQLNRWPEDGANDYGAAIYRLSAYLTPAFRQALIEDFEAKANAGELKHRVRTLQAVADAGFAANRVTQIGAAEWHASLDLELTETVRGMTVKHTYIQYPLRIVRYAVDPETNPWGLALAGYVGNGPTRLALSDSETTHAGLSQ